MEITTSEQCASAFATMSFYHADVVEKIKDMISEATDQSELDIVSGLLRGSLRHLLDESQARFEQDGR